LPNYRLPYGNTHLDFDLPGSYQTQLLVPAEVVPAPDPGRVVEAALDAPVGGRTLAALVKGVADRGEALSAAIAINDKTRPVPHEHLLPPLLACLEGLGLPPAAITLLIGTGTHVPMRPDEFAGIVPGEILARYPVICHDADDREGLVYVGQTARGTETWINRRFMEAGVRIVVGDIEPHQFAGFSGGVKTAAIGLAGRESIHHNHSMMSHPGAQLGRYEDNPLRQDIEEIGRLAGVDYALNGILNEDRQIVRVLAGDPAAIMAAAVPLVRQLFQVPVDAPFDLMLVSPGGHPKDINLYQGQKALGHAALVVRDGGTIILAAACPEGTGSRAYEEWMAQEPMDSYQVVLDRYRREGFRIGPHKAFQIARDASRTRVLFLSEMAPEFARHLLLTPVASLEDALASTLPGLGPGARIGVMPWANTTAPFLLPGAEERMKDHGRPDDSPPASGRKPVLH
jgi:lactate racemase